MEQLARQAAARRRLAYRPGTVSNRFSHWRLYLGFCRHFSLNDCPATPHTLSLFVEFLLRTYKTPKAVTNVVASVRYLHLRLAAPTSAFDDFHFAHTRRAFTLSVRHRPLPAPPCTLAILERLCTALGSLGGRGVVFRALCSVAFHSLLRLSSLLPPALPFDPSRFPTTGDLIEVREGFLLRVKFAKNAQDASQAFVIPLVLADSPTVCPVRAIQALLRLVPRGQPGHPLFPWPSEIRGGSLTPCDPLTAPAARRWLRIALAQAGLSPSAITFHSFRRGGATLAALRGATKADLQALGNWRSNAVLAYYPPLPASLRAARLVASSP